MKISVITPTLNSANFIEHCLQSIKSQKNVHVEHIVVDGGSTDATESIVSKFPHAKFVNLPGSNIYEALNYGINISKGQYIAFLNSDDYYEDDDVLRVVASEFSDNSVDIIYADCIMVDINHKYLYTFRPMQYLKFEIASRLVFVLPHPSTFFRRNVFSKIGLYETSLKFSSDCEYILRCLSLGVKFKKLNIVASRFMRHNNNASSNPVAANDIKTILCKYKPNFRYFNHRLLFLLHSITNIDYIKYIFMRNLFRLRDKMVLKK